MTSLVCVTPPEVEPVTVAEAIAHLRLDALNLEPTPGAPVASLANLGAGNVNVGAHRYRITFVTSEGETTGGDITAPISVSDATDNGQIKLTEIPLPSSSRITARRVYRTRANKDFFYLVGTISDAEETEYTDNVADSALGRGAPTSNTAGDPTVSSLIAAARLDAEQYLRKALITQTWRYTLDWFPASGVISLPMPPLQAIDGEDGAGFEYMDLDGTWRVVDPDLYRLDTDGLPGRIIRRFNAVWPQTYPEPSAVRIQFLAGYGDAASDVPELIRAGIKLLLAELFENREVTLTGTISTELKAVKRCLGDRFLEAL